MDASSHWPVLQLAEFVAAVTTTADEEGVQRAAVERAAEAVDAEVGAYLSADGEVVVAVGFGGGGPAPPQLSAAVQGRWLVLDVPGCGPCPTLIVPLDDDPGGTLVFARSDAPFSGEEQALLRAMGRVLALVLRARRTMNHALDDAVHQATHDQLTGLPNRTLVLDRLEQALARAEQGGRPATVFFVDLDRFKLVNDFLGHQKGDRVLVEVGERLRGSVRPDDTVGRLSGDEFVVVCERLDDEEADEVAGRMARAISAPMAIDRHEARITASIGIARGETVAEAEHLLGDADVALYRAKEGGRARVEHFDHRLRDRMQHRLRTEQALRAALPADELSVHYQPAVWTPSGSVLGMEALVRWQHPERGLILPGAFIEVAEETGLIVPIGAWVLEQACVDAVRWQREIRGLEDVSVAVNLSARQLADPDLIGRVTDTLARTGLSADHLWLELTESTLMEDADTTLHTLDALREAGVHLSIDDFGTGYSSLSYLRRFRVDAVKIDQSFIDGVADTTEEQVIVRAVLRLAEELGLTPVAEGVETIEQSRALGALGCQICQGYLYGRPVPYEELADLVAHAQRSRPLRLATAADGTPSPA